MPRSAPLRLPLLATAVLLGGSSHAAAQTIPLQDAFPSLPRFASPVDIQAPPDASGRLAVVEQAGVVRMFTNSFSASTSAAFLDIRALVEDGGELGLLGLAFHPGYSTNRTFFVYYTRRQPNPDSASVRPYQSVIARYSASPGDPNDADEASGTVLLTVNQPYGNHKAGQLHFGPDGHLYAALGDGGSGGDPLRAGQSVRTLLGKILRLDVDGGGLAPECGGDAGPYTIPADNPFAGATAGCGEIYALGLRNPFRFSFGPDGTLWAADVGQGAWEEIDWVTKGGNYGWNVREGRHCYGAATCATAGLTDPVHEYGHDAAGGFSVTGGYVMPATSGCSALAGRYVFADYVSRNVWAADYDATGVTHVTRVVNGGQAGSIRISTFGLDPANNRLLMADLGGGRLYTFGCSALPVELTAFTAAADGPRVRLAWATASETNNAGFAVETRRGEAADGWREVAFVIGHGTTSEARTYAHDVQGLAPGRHAFRLRQTDADGTVRTSAEAEATVGAGGPLVLVRVGPEPFRDGTAVRLAVDAARTVEVGLFDALGRRVAVLHRGAVAPDAPVTLRIDGRGLPAGLYVIRAAGGAYTATLTALRVR